MNKPQVGFTVEHLKYLERMFPELVNTTDTNELLVNSGKRSVVKHIEHLVTSNKKQIIDG